MRTWCKLTDSIFDLESITSQEYDNFVDEFMLGDEHVDADANDYMFLEALRLEEEYQESLAKPQTITVEWGIYLAEIEERNLGQWYLGSCSYPAIVGKNDPILQIEVYKTFLDLVSFHLQELNNAS